MTSASPSPLAGTLPPDHLNLLLDSTGEGIFGIDMDGRCTFVNQAAARTLGFSTDMVLGRNMHELIHHSHADGRHYPECDCPIFNAFRRGLPCRIDDEVIWRADGSSFPAEYSSHPIIENGLVRGAVVTFVDISERKRAEELLRRSHDEMEQRVAERTAQLRELANHLETMRETERKRIAREIHDELGSLLVALKMDLNWLERRVGDNALRESMVAKCQRMGGLVDTAVDAVGRIITDLGPVGGAGMAGAGVRARQQRRAGGRLQDVRRRRRTAARGRAGHRGVPHPAGGAVQRGAARAGEEGVHPHRRRRAAAAGAVPAGARRRRGHHARSPGVMGLRERAAHFGGRVGIETAPGRGTTVRLMLPLSAGEGQT